LADLGALDGQGRTTTHGRALARLPLHPRLAHMRVVAGPEAADLAALLSDRDPLRGAGADLEARLRAIRDPGGRHPFEVNRQGVSRIRAEATRLRRMGASRDAGGGAAPPGPPSGYLRQDEGGWSAGAMAALAYPDRIGLRRPGEEARFVLSGGKGAVMAGSDALAGQRLIVALDLDGDPREARIRLAARIEEAELRALLGGRIVPARICDWSRREGRVRARL
ncbi:ATP-dependent helicase HrpB, partial [Paracoccus liaowanqingii]